MPEGLHGINVGSLTEKVGVNCNVTIQNEKVPFKEFEPDGPIDTIVGTVSVSSAPAQMPSILMEINADSGKETNKAGKTKVAGDKNVNQNEGIEILKTRFFFALLY